MEITKEVKPFIRRGAQYFWQYSVYANASQFYASQSCFFNKYIFNINIIINILINIITI